ncbi:hypothetical protein ACFSTE_08910 [Aquimarina hainanensis]|uniref:Cytochrome c domain-containing protein n=1 Tax=Aquimarina hainanensis TaxID=1578017 RepID=A0ABW5N9U2_9FLAO|nr:hypothetical protein [Aquimarina sp. TRL1]QKX03891.1 hypothetical protein HN014_02875 [Aquimarina sp. TRL1]
MGNWKLKNSISLFFLISFIFIRIINFHTTSHLLFEDELAEQSCEYCHALSATERNVFLYTPTIPEIHPIAKKIPEVTTAYFAYISPVKKVRITDYYLNKPPPEKKHFS